MAVYIGASDPDFYVRQQESMRRSVQGLMAAMDAFEKKRRERAMLELQAGLKTPGWVESENAKSWLAKSGKKFPELTKVYEAERGRKALVNQYFQFVRANEDLGFDQPYRDAFSVFRGDQRADLLDILAGDLKMPVKEIMPDQFDWDDQTKEAASLRHAMEGRVPGVTVTPEEYSTGIKAQAGLVLRPGVVQEESVKQGNRLTAIEARGDEARKTVRLRSELKVDGEGGDGSATTTQRRFTKELFYDELLGGLPQVSLPTNKRGAFPTGAASQAKLQDTHQARWAGSMATKLLRLNELIDALPDEQKQEIRSDPRKMRVLTPSYYIERYTLFLNKGVDEEGRPGMSLDELEEAVDAAIARATAARLAAQNKPRR